MDNIINIKFEGTNFNPDKVQISEIADLLLKIGDGVTAIKVRANIQEDINISLESIIKGSLNINIKCLPKLLMIFATIIPSIKVTDIEKSDLPNKTKTMFHIINHFDQKYSCNTGFYYKDMKTPFYIIPSENIFAEEKFTILRGTKTVYGTLERIGGIKQCTAEIKPIIGGTTFIADLSRSSGEELAKLLYKKVIVKGEATIENDKIINFKIQEFRVFNPANIDESLNKIRELIGSDMDKIKDPIAFVRGLRDN